MRRPLLFICVCLFVFIALGTQIADPPPWNSEIAVSVAEDVLVVGQVYKKEYKKTFDQETIIFYLDVINYSNEAEASNQEIYQKIIKKTSPNLTKIICEMYIDDLPYRENGELFIPFLGETILLQGKWQKFAHATNPGEFDYANYYAIEGISGKVKGTQLLISNQKQWYVREKLFQIRQRLLQNLYDAFEQKEAAILAKMLLGDGGGLDKEVRDLYQENGIVHILSISGLHISIIGMGIYKLLRKGSLPIYISAPVGGMFIVLYGMMTGFGVSACRAIGMYLIRMLGEIWGKTYDMLTAMGVLAILLVVDNPRLVYHSGYLLSFASVCGVGLLAPLFPKVSDMFPVRPYDNIGKKWIKKHVTQVGDGLAISLSVTLFTLPIQLFFFYKIPVYSIVINLLIIPFMSVVMIIGFTVMLLPGLSFLCPLESCIFTWFELLCYIFQKMPEHTWITGRPELWKIVLYYIILLLLIGWGKRMKKFVLFGTLTSMVLWLGTRVIKEKQITFLDVGQGDCICVQTASGECYLFDGGSSNRTLVGEKIILPYLYFCGISRVDAVFVTHADVDHTSGLKELLSCNEIAIDRLVLPRVKDAESEFQELLIAIDEKVQVEYVTCGAILENKEYQITCLHPPMNYEADRNAYSACYLLEMEEMNVLLTGDVEGEGEVLLTRELERKGIKHIDILKVAHHGSRYSTTQEFLSGIEVRLAVISCGKNNNYGHPHKETLERLKEEGCDIHITAKQGAVVFKWGE